MLELIGTGSFGTVYKGRRRGTAEIVALKFIPKRGRTDKEVWVSGLDGHGAGMRVRGWTSCVHLFL